MTDTPQQTNDDLLDIPAFLKRASGDVKAPPARKPRFNHRAVQEKHRKAKARAARERIAAWEMRTAAERGITEDELRTELAEKRKSKRRCKRRTR